MGQQFKMVILVKKKFKLSHRPLMSCVKKA
jgi:hypothetical protein